MQVVSLPELKGKILESAQLDGETEEWVFQFSGKICLQANAPWRLVVENRIRLGWRDHGHRFGLARPADAPETLPIGSSVTEASIDDPTGDLCAGFVGRALSEVSADPWGCGV